jgi:hypothetical protein
MSQNSNLVRDPDYHAARAAEERELAEAAADSNARAIHLQLAEEHSRLAEAAAEPELTAGDVRQAG